MMIQWTVVTHDDERPEPFRYVSRMVVRAGVPAPEDGMIPLSPGVERGQPVVVIGQDSGDRKSRQGSQLQAISAKDALELSGLLRIAALTADPTLLSNGEGEGG